MYRSLLLQLFQGFPDLQTILNDTDLVPRSRAGCPHFVELKQLFRAAASRLGQRSVLCYIDALDECDEQQVRDMIVFFQDIVVDIENTSPSVRVCFSSRPYPHIQTRLGHTITLEQQHGHRIDLLEYVNRRLLVTGSLATELRAGLLEKASGVFMWVLLAVGMLNDEHNQGSGGRALRSILDQLPPQLSDLFRSILLRDSKHTDRLRLSLWWVLGTKEPMRPEAFCHAVSFWEFPRTPDQFGLWEQPDVSRLEDQRRLVAVYSKGLVEVTKGDRPHVQFIHESVRDFLIKDRGVQDLWPDVGFDWEGQCKTQLKDCCVAYLNYSFTAVPLVSRTLSNINLLMASISPKEILRRVPFLEHAWKHLAEREVRFEATDFVSDYQARICRYPLLDWVKIVNCFRVLACGCGMKLIRRSRSPALVPVDGTGDSNNCRELIDGAGSEHVFATLNMIFDPVFVKSYFATSLMTWASWYGNGRSGYDLVHVVMLLVALGVGPGPNADTDESKSTWIAPNSRATLMQQLIAAGADVNQPIDGSPPLGFAPREGKYAICEMLLQAGATVNSRGQYGKTPLILAATHGHDRICGLLLEYGADVDAVDKQGLSALYFAILNGHKACVRRLVEAGADLGAKCHVDKRTRAVVMDKAAKTPLEIAFENFIDAEIAGILVEAGADVTILMAPNGETLLHQIARRKSCSKDLEVARFLIQAGADVNAEETITGLTPLRLAQDQDKRELCKLLEAHGAQRSSHPWLTPRQALLHRANPMKRPRDT